jgi:hypothetical protein
VSHDQKFPPVTHAYNPSHTGGRDREDWSSRPAWAKSWDSPPSQQIHQVWHTIVVSATWEAVGSKIMMQASLHKNETFYLVNNLRGAGGVAQVEECLYSKRETLSSNSSTIIK